MEFLTKLEPVFGALKDAVMETLRRAGRLTPHKYPFGNPVSIERCHLPILKSVKYWITEKTDGTRVCMLFTETSKAVPVAVMMDRVGNIYGLPVSCDPELFQGSIFDAELLRNVDGTYTIHVFDVAMLEGEVLRHEPLSDRLQLIEDVLEGTDVTIEGLKLVCKRMFPLSDLDGFKSYVETHGHESDGYILTPEKEQAALPGTAWSVYKIKTIHTIDLLWVDGQLWYGSGEELLRIDGLPDWHISVESSDLSKLRSSSIVEFAVYIQDKQLQLKLMCERPDKAVPNNALCVMRTIASIKDAVTLADLAS